MSTIDTSHSLYGFMPLFQPSGVAEQISSAATPRPRREDDVWRQLIDKQIVEWGLNPFMLEDDGITPPSRSAIDLAAMVAVRLRDIGMRAPTRIVPDGNGGIAFEWEAGDAFCSLDISQDAAAEGILYKHGKIESRDRLI